MFRVQGIEVEVFGGLGFWDPEFRCSRFWDVLGYGTWGFGFWLRPRGGNINLLMPSTVAQRVQYPLIKGYSLHHNMNPLKFKVYSLIKGYWALWECKERLSSTHADLL